jgi:hypothetical protein
MKPRGQVSLFYRLFCLWLSVSIISPSSFAKTKPRVLVTPIERVSFVKNGNKYLVVKERNAQGRLIKQSVVGPHSIEMMRDLQDRGVMDYWFVQNRDLKMTATEPLLGIYRRIDVEKVEPDKGIRKLRYAYRPRLKKYALVERSFEKAKVLQRASEVATVFAGGAIIDDQNKACGMLNQGYTNDLWDIFAASAESSKAGRYKEFFELLANSKAVDKSCQSPAKEVVLEALSEIAITADEDIKLSGARPKFLSCMESLKLSANASNISNILASATCRNSSLIECNASITERGHYSAVAQPPKPPVVIKINPGNREFPDTEAEVQKTIFHELLHNSGIADEGLTEDIQDCCSQSDMESLACGRVRSKVRSIEESQDTQKTLTGSILGDSYFAFADEVRAVIAPASDSENTISNAFTKRAEDIFQGEFEKFKAAIGPQGACARSANPSQCVETARSNFVASYQYQVSSTCREGTYQAALREDAREGDAGGCTAITKAAAELAKKASDVMSLKEFETQCRSGSSPPSSTKSTLFIELLRGLIERSYAESNLLGKKPAPAMSLAPGMIGTSIFPSAADEDLIGRCQLASECYGIPSTVVTEAEVSSGNLRNDQSAVADKSLRGNGGQSPRVIGEVGAGAPSRETSFEAATPSLVHFDAPASPSVPQEITWADSDGGPDRESIGTSVASRPTRSLFRKLDPNTASRLPDPEEKTSHVLRPLKSAFDNIIPTAHAATPAGKLAGEKLREITTGGAATPTASVVTTRSPSSASPRPSMSSGPQAKVSPSSGSSPRSASAAFDMEKQLKSLSRED